MKLWFKLAFREIRNNTYFSLFFVLNLSFGLLGFIALDSFKDSIHDHISKGSKAYLAADLEISSNLPLKKDDLEYLEKIIGPFSMKTRQITFLSMVSSPSATRLVQIIAIEENYPLYGKILLKKKGRATPEDLEKDLFIGNKVWAQPELLATLRIDTGETLKIGELEAKITRQVIESPGGSFWTAQLGYKLFIGMPQVHKTGLVKLGSRRRHIYLYKLPKGSSAKEIHGRLQDGMTKRFGINSSVNSKTFQSANRQTRRFLNYLNDYLGLVSLVALFLAGIGSDYLFRGYFTKNIKEIAILMSLGATKKSTFKLILLQISILGTIAALGSSLLSLAVLPLLTRLIENFLPKGFESFISWQSLILSMGIGLFGSVLFCLPALRRIYKINPQILFQEDQRSSQLDDEKIRLPAFLIYLPVLIVSWSLSVWQSHSFIIGTAFTICLLLSFMIIGLLGYLLLKIISASAPKNSLITKLSFRNFSRNKVALISNFLAIGMGALLINLIPQLQQGLQNELGRPDSSKIPDFFLFDIQPEQVEPLEKLLIDKKLPLRSISPMIRARLTHVNDKLFSEDMDAHTESHTREQEEQRRVRNRGYNLSFRAKLSSAETIIEGTPFSGTFDIESSKLPEISIEEQFARRLSVELNDRLIFDVQGIPVEGVIVNLRKVDWTGFEPNFFVLFQPGVLEEAPSTYLATLSDVPTKKRVSIQTRIIQDFSNISILDVSRILRKAIDITNQISWALQSMAFLTVLAGLIVVYSLSRFNAQNRQQEVNLLKILGAKFSDIRAMTLLEFGLIGFLSALIGTLISLLISRVLSYVIFKSQWEIAWNTATITIISVSLMSLLTGYLGVRKTLKSKPKLLLDHQ
ncbi:MAG: FtsX-like permease family protein [Proteobacteria bacterium]|nr:FtsX-like permease family protein [Pseudomonadota bacterium]